MTHWRRLIERDFMGAWDLVDKSGKAKDFTLEIVEVKSQGVYQPGTTAKKRKLTIRFRGAEKALIAGATICGAIESMYGADIERWIGKSVTLYQTTTRVQGKDGVPCVRVRPKAPTSQAEPLPSQPVDQDMRAKQDEAFGRQPGED